MKRTILFGGSFNPIHFGHLWMAQAALETLGAKSVLFMPTGDAPHKEVELAAAHRANMVELALRDSADFIYSDFEIRKDEPSYTIRTVEHLLESEPDQKIWLLIGEDSLLQFHTWKDYEKLLKLVTLAVAPRYHTLDISPSEQEKKLWALGAKIHRIPMKRIELSSTWVRKRARLGRTLVHLVPDAVEAYIRKHGLYRDEPLESMRAQLQKSLGNGRFAHSLRVAETAEQLAQRHGVDPEKALLAGLLHDCAKGCEEELLSLPAIRASFTQRDEPKALWHTYLGPIAAKQLYGMHDEEVLQAIRVHTTAAQTMTALDKILFVADKTEPGRADPINGRLLACAMEDLDEGFFRVLHESIAYLKAKNLAVHPTTRALYGQLYKERQLDPKNRFNSDGPSR